MAAGVLIVTRHAERQDYWDLENERNWVATAKRPFDSPLTETGLEQATLCGKRILSLCKTLGKPKPTHAYSSPFLRCAETCSNISASVGGIQKLRIENGLSESLTAGWYLSWGAPGADSTWLGPNSEKGRKYQDEEMHKLAFEPASSLFISPRMLETCQTVSLPIDQTYKTDQLFNADVYSWKHLESREDRRKRLKQTVETITLNHINETVVINTHSGPCVHIFEELTKEPSPTHSCGYTAISIYEYKIDKNRKFEWKNIVLNDTQHLNGTIGGVYESPKI